MMTIGGHTNSVPANGAYDPRNIFARIPAANRQTDPDAAPHHIKQKIPPP